MKATIRVPLLLVLAAAGLIVARRAAADREEAARETAMTTLRLRAWAQNSSEAGVSIQPKQVPAADPGELARVKELPGYHTYAMRCASCHVLPDPAAHSPREWLGTVDLMRFRIGQAGVVPPADSELAAVKEFLGAASRELRTD